MVPEDKFYRYKIFIFYVLVQIAFYGCDLKVKTRFEISKDSTEKHKIIQKNLSHKFFKNSAAVTKELTISNGMPVTAFSIEYPDGYATEYFPEKGRYYVRLRKLKDGVVEQEITIGRSQKISNERDALSVLNKMDSVFSASKNIKFEKKFLGKNSIGRRDLFNLQALVNFDKLRTALFMDDYLSTTVIVFPPSEELEGVNISFLRRIANEAGSQGLTKEEVMMLDSFDYNLL